MDLRLKLKKGEVIEKGEVLVELEIVNDSDRDVYIPRDLLLLDGFTSDKFNVVKHTAEGDVGIDYEGKFVKYSPGKELLESNGKITNILNLAEAYDFHGIPGEGKYSVTYNSPSIWYDDEDQVCVGEGFQVNLEDSLSVI
jgi:hypothetical protein